MKTILVSAFGCAPFRGSEIGVGWNWILQMAQNNVLYVITVKRNKNVIESNIPDDIRGNVHFYYYDLSDFWIKVMKPESLLFYLFYFIWQLGIIGIIKDLKKKYQFDYSMHLTFGSIWLPTFLPFFGIPFIWGPIGGGDGIPNSFLKVFDKKTRLIQWFRKVLKRTYALNPLAFYVCYRSKVIIVRTKQTKEVIPPKYHHKVKVFLETAIESEIFEYNKQKEKQEKVRLIITGRLIPSKNIITALTALRYLPDNYSYILTIIGSGILKKNLTQKVLEYGLSEKVEFIDAIPRKEIINQLVNSDIYLFPSLVEGGSWALMEAMAIGLPVICLKYAGMEVITDEDSAILLDVTNPEQMPKDMAQAICKLVDDPELSNRIGIAARERIKNLFNWEAKGVFMEQLLKELDYEL